MLFEHLIYSTAIAIIAGMLWYKRTGRDPSWIIIASAYAPDFDIVAGELFRKLDLNILISSSIKQGFPQHCLPAALRLCGGAGAEAGRHEVQGFVPVRGIFSGARKPKNGWFFAMDIVISWPGKAQRWGIGMKKNIPVFR